MKANATINKNYEVSISKIISTLSKTEKKLRKEINELENFNQKNSTEINDSLKLLSIQSEKTLEILNHFNSMILNTIFTIHNINNLEVK